MQQVHSTAQVAESTWAPYHAKQMVWCVDWLAGFTVKRIFKLAKGGELVWFQGVITEGGKKTEIGHKNIFDNHIAEVSYGLSLQQGTKLKQVNPITDYEKQMPRTAHVW